MPLVETEATQESACVSTAPVFNEWSYKDGSKGWWLFPPRRDSKDAAILWWLWLVVVTMAASLGEMGYAERFFLYCLVLASQALLPCSSGCIAPFWAMILSLPFLIQKSYDEGGAWTYSMLFFLFGIVPLIDILSGADVTNHSKKEQREREQDWKYRLPTLVGALAVWVNCMHLAWRARDFSGFELVGAALSCGIYTGSVGITVGHELCHRASFYERLFGKLAITVCGYGHFAVEHSLGHHKKVGLDDDPATARFGENFWSFLPRCIIGEFRSALKLTLEHGTLFSELVLPYAFSGAFLVSLTVIVGKVTAIPFFLIQAFMAVLLFESVNFLEHYGLERRILPTGVPEVVDASHSWDSPNRFTNQLLFNLQRHADHHAHAGKRYQCLQLSDTSPTLPAGYATMILLAFFPPLWRWAVHPRVLSHRRNLLQNNPDMVFRHVGAPSKKVI